jgi:3-oxoacyl-[acyl-carrier protein] reductase
VKLTADQFRHQLDCAVVGHHVLLAELWRQCFRPRGGGYVLAVLSAAQGPATAPHMAGYVAAKGGFEALLRAAAAELGRAGLRISVVRPGYVETPMLDAFDARLLDRARAASPGRRFLRPSDVASALVAALHCPPGPGVVGEIPLDGAQAGAA